MQPAVIVKVSGGCVQSVITNDPRVKVLILDYDVEGDEDVTSFPEPDGSMEAAVGWIEEPMVDPRYTKELLAREQRA